MTIETVTVEPFPDQIPGTSGLRKKVSVFRQAGYLEAFVQAIFDSVPALRGGTLVVGGDGRFHNEHAIGVIVAMAAANGVSRVLVARGGLLSTPAASAVIRGRGAQGGIILSASHNPGGPDGDFGIKFNGANGGPAAPAVTDAIAQATRDIRRYRIETGTARAFDELGSTTMAGGTVVEVFDPVRDYADLLETIFDFASLRALFAGGFRMRFDAMNAITGPYARAILEERLGAPAGTVVNAVPLPDFGGLHPDPNPVHAAALIAAMRADPALVLGAASDGDGDRNLIVADGGEVVGPSDSLAIIAANAALVPAHRRGIAGVARSMPTSRAVDAVAAALDVKCYETPTGWKFFGNLLDAGLISLCGEESAGTGADHIREKDGIWAVLMWLSIVAGRGMAPSAILRDHWRRFGRHYYQRHDYEDLDAGAAQEMIAELRGRLATLPGASVAGLTVAGARDFSYFDPVEETVTDRQGIQLDFTDGSRLVARLSGTGTSGATLRLYLERFSPDRLDEDPAAMLKPVAQAAAHMLSLVEKTGRTEPTVIA